MSAPVWVAAADLGASGGRVVAGRVGPGLLDVREVHRFANVPVTAVGTLHWDILRLYQEILDGLGSSARDFELASIGIDSWGVDYGLLDSAGALLGNPVHYRDGRTEGVTERVLAAVPATELYAVTGIQQLPINTIVQLVAAAESPQLSAASTLLLIPDLLGYWLTGEIGAEVTNASTTQLYDVTSRTWAGPLMERVGIPARLFPPLRQPGEQVGGLAADVADAGGLPAGLRVTAVASHDTASAVVAVPARDRAFAYISCGTWSLVGLELDQPVLTDASRLANFTNETGVDCTIRYLRNVMGLWLLQESERTWARTDAVAGRPPVRTADLIAEAAKLPPLGFVVDPDAPPFLAPGDMPARIADACRATGHAAPGSRAETVRCILDSLALAHARAVTQAQDLSGQPVRVVHMVGGGSRNELLCQLTADACGLPVVAGPAEATAIGNVLIQARA
ncbi:MAG: rhamnulokinase, partial [Actinobacteria bacterium]|nr:rhamnulokinase [Actinomycetota bacterium]